MWQNSKNLNVTKLKNSKFDKTQNSKKQKKTKLNIWQYFIKKTQILKNLTILNFDQTHKLKLWEKILKTQVVTKLKKLNDNKTKKNFTCNKTQKLEMVQNSTQKNDLKQKQKKLRKTWHLENQWDIFEAAICNLAMFFIKSCVQLLFI